MTQATEDCERAECLGTCFFDTACSCFVCELCSHHNRKDFCAKCGYDEEKDHDPFETLLDD